MSAAFDAWLVAHPEYAPRFYRVEHVKEHRVRVPAEDASDAAEAP